MTESDFQKGKGVGASILITESSIWSRKKLLTKRESCEQGGPDMEIEWKDKGTSLCVGLSGSRFDRGVS